VLSYHFADFTLVVGSRGLVEGWIQVGGADLEVMTWMLDQQLRMAQKVISKMENCFRNGNIGRGVLRYLTS
jgi:hypothetical protein